MNRMNSSEKAAEIPKGVSKSMQIAETATNKAAQVTGFVGLYKTKEFFLLVITKLQRNKLVLQL
jgi:hypothetical protein